MSLPSRVPVETTSRPFHLPHLAPTDGMVMTSLDTTLPPRLAAPDANSSKVNLLTPTSLRTYTPPLRPWSVFATPTAAVAGGALTSLPIQPGGRLTLTPDAVVMRLPASAACPLKPGAEPLASEAAA